MGKYWKMCLKNCTKSYVQVYCMVSTVCWLDRVDMFALEWGVQCSGSTSPLSDAETRLSSHSSRGRDQQVPESPSPVSKRWAYLVKSRLVKDIVKVHDDFLLISYDEEPKFFACRIVELLNTFATRKIQDTKKSLLPRKYDALFRKQWEKHRMLQIWVTPC